MENNNSRFEHLLARFREGTASPDELDELLKMVQDPALTDELRRMWEHMPADAHHFDEATSRKILSSVLQDEPQSAIPMIQPRRRRFLVPAIAASIALFIAAAWAFVHYTSSKPSMPIVVNEPTQQPVQIMPGNNKAILQLSGGRTILLDSTADGSLINEGDARISKKDGQIVYQQSGNAATEEDRYNTLITPKGGQYQLILSDGTKVWMNAASSLKYPSSFTGSTREVELTGEAYFEVAKNPGKPFHVQLNGMDIEVLGTHFNVNAYDNEESINTTLLEGVVKVKGGLNDVQLKPGQQASGQPGKALRVLNDVDVDGVVAWKNGYFQFDQAGLDVLMRQIERWYDVTVKFEGKVPNRQFGGKISRNSNINDVLRILELTKVGFRIEGKTIIVTDKS